MFKFPQNLFENYKAIQRCSLVKNKSDSEENLKEFETYLNDAQPIDEYSYNLELFTKNLFRGNQENFINTIKGKNSECLILWTESRSIVKLLQLNRCIFIHYNSDTRKYTVTRHRYNNNNNNNNLMLDSTNNTSDHLSFRDKLMSQVSIDYK